MSLRHYNAGLPLLIEPDWPAPAGVRAVCTGRQGGYSQGRFASFNLATHVNDSALAVWHNRRLLQRVLGLKSAPVWLDQVHGTTVVFLKGHGQMGMPADASITTHKSRVCAVMTADCLPVLICDRSASIVAAVHAGWRGLAAGILEKTLQAMADSSGVAGLIY